MCTESVVIAFPASLLSFGEEAHCQQWRGLLFLALVTASLFILGSSGACTILLRIGGTLYQKLLRSKEFQNTSQRLSETTCAFLMSGLLAGNS